MRQHTNDIRCPGPAEETTAEACTEGLSKRTAWAPPPRSSSRSSARAWAWAARARAKRSSSARGATSSASCAWRWHPSSASVCAVYTCRYGLHVSISSTSVCTVSSTSVCIVSTREAFSYSNRSQQGSNRMAVFSNTDCTESNLNLSSSRDFLSYGTCTATRTAVRRYGREAVSPAEDCGGTQRLFSWIPVSYTLATCTVNSVHVD
eukprot:COSAG02_NODE_52_length_44175_cov_97.989654_12_plen_206_part_00